MISIVIPVWKTLYLSRTIESVLAQTFEDFELIVVEGRRLETFDQILSNYTDSRIRVFRHDPMPVVENWNQCMAYANGDFSILLCDDDIFTARHVERLMQLAEKYSEVDVFHSRIRFVDDNDGLVDMSPICGEYETAIDFIYQKLRYSRPQFVSDFMYRTSKFRAIGGFVDRPMAWFTDVDTSFAMALPNGVAFSEEPTFCYRSADQNISSNLELRDALLAVQMHYSALEGTVAALKGCSDERADLILSNLSKMHVKARSDAYLRCGVGKYPFWPLVQAILLKRTYPIPLIRGFLASIYAVGQRKNVKSNL